MDAHRNITFPTLLPVGAEYENVIVEPASEDQFFQWIMKMVKEPSYPNIKENGDIKPNAVINFVLKDPFMVPEPGKRKRGIWSETVNMVYEMWSYFVHGYNMSINISVFDAKDKRSLVATSLKMLNLFRNHVDNKAQLTLLYALLNRVLCSVVRSVFQEGTNAHVRTKYERIIKKITDVMYPIPVSQKAGVISAFVESHKRHILCNAQGIPALTALNFGAVHKEEYTVGEKGERIRKAVALPSSSQIPDIHQCARQLMKPASSRGAEITGDRVTTQRQTIFLVSPGDSDAFSVAKWAFIDVSRDTEIDFFSKIDSIIREGFDDVGLNDNDSFWGSKNKSAPVSFCESGLGVASIPAPAVAAFNNLPLTRPRPNRTVVNTVVGDGKINVNDFVNFAIDNGTKKAYTYQGNDFDVNSALVRVANIGRDMHEQQQGIIPGVNDTLHDITRCVKNGLFTPGNQANFGGNTISLLEAVLTTAITPVRSGFPQQGIDITNLAAYANRDQDIACIRGLFDCIVGLGFDLTSYEFVRTCYVFVILMNALLTPDGDVYSQFLRPAQTNDSSGYTHVATLFAGDVFAGFPNPMPQSRALLWTKDNSSALSNFNLNDNALRYLDAIPLGTDKMQSLLGLFLICVPHVDRSSVMKSFMVLGLSPYTLANVSVTSMITETYIGSPNIPTMQVNLKPRDSVVPDPDNNSALHVMHNAFSVDESMEGCVVVTNEIVNNHGTCSDPTIFSDKERNHSGVATPQMPFGHLSIVCAPEVVLPGYRGDTVVTQGEHDSEHLTNGLYDTLNNWLIQKATGIRTFLYINITRPVATGDAAILDNDARNYRVDVTCDPYSDLDHSPMVRFHNCHRRFDDNGDPVIHGSSCNLLLGVHRMSRSAFERNVCEKDEIRGRGVPFML